MFECDDAIDGVAGAVGIRIERSPKVADVGQRASSFGGARHEIVPCALEQAGCSDASGWARSTCPPF